MKHICFFYILRYRSIRNVGISLDAWYRYVVNDSRKTISISEGNRTVSTLWPDGISSFAAIVGNNGAGKTTCMLYMLQALANGSGEKDPEAIVIYQDEEGMHVYIPQTSGYRLDRRLKDKIHVTTDCPHVDMFYYSSYFRPFRYVHEPGEGELEGVYNASDTWRLIKDYQDYANVDTTYRTEPIGYHLDAMKSQDDNRIVQLLYDDELRKLLPRNALPRYILVEPNASGYKRTLYEERKNNPDGFNVYVPQFGSKKDDLLAHIVTMILFNIGVENGMPYIHFKLYIEKWEYVYRQTNDIVKALVTFVKETPNPAYQFMREMQEVVVFLSKACDCVEYANLLYIDAKLIKNKENLDKLRNYYMCKSFVVAHYFDLGYAHKRTSATQLSSGEFDMLKFFSRIYDAVFEYPRRFDNIYSPQLILIDEAENSYHPEWQRKFVNLLLKFMHAVYYRCKGNKDFQIVLTTHSPILLSDIPNVCVNYLEKRVTVQVVKNQPETFGTNVFELYKHAFFMKEGLIGEFAQNKILAIQHAIENPTQSIRETIDAIELIGDKAIKAYLLSLLERDYPREMVSYHQRKIKELTERADAADQQN